MKYIAFFDTDDFQAEHRTVAPAASNVVAYMANVLGQTCHIEIISPTRTLNVKGFYPGRKTSLNERITVIHPPSFGVRTRVGALFSALFVRIWLFFFLISHLKNKEEIIVYHSLAYMTTIKLLKVIKKLRIILEVREIYGDVKSSYDSENSMNYFSRKREYDYFSIADKYIFPTELLNRAVNFEGKPYVIATGIYKMEKKISEKSDDGYIHVVYAGTLVPEKGGAAAAAAAKFLPKNYHVHILGYGSEDMIERIKTIIMMTQKESKATVTYDGLLHGDEFKSFLQTCHIGLATQDPSGVFNDTSFPSKILTYLSNGLEVLSCRIRAVEESPVGEYVHYYEEQSPQAIAAAIQKIQAKHSEVKRFALDELDASLRTEIVKLIET